MTIKANQLRGQRWEDGDPEPDGFAQVFSWDTVRYVRDHDGLWESPGPRDPAVGFSWPDLVRERGPLFVYIADAHDYMARIGYPTDEEPQEVVQPEPDPEVTVMWTAAEPAASNPVTRWERTELGKWRTGVGIGAELVTWAELRDTHGPVFHARASAEAEHNDRVENDRLDVLGSQLGRANTTIAWWEQQAGVVAKLAQEVRSNQPRLIRDAEDWWDDDRTSPASDVYQDLMRTADHLLSLCDTVAARYRRRRDTIADGLDNPPNETT